MNKSDIENRLRRVGFESGRLMRLRGDSPKMFWNDGPNPPYIQALFDDNNSIVKEYLTGKNGHTSVAPRSVLLFLGIHLVETITSEPEYVELTRERYILKWLYGDKILFWNVDLLNTQSEDDLNDLFEVIVK